MIISRRRDKEVVQVVVRWSSLAKSSKPNRGSEHKGGEATGDPQQPAGASGCSGRPEYYCRWAKCLQRKLIVSVIAHAHTADLAELDAPPFVSRCLARINRVVLYGSLWIQAGPYASLFAYRYHHRSCRFRKTVHQDQHRRRRPRESMILALSDPSSR